MVLTLQLFEFGEDMRVEPPHRCPSVCGDSCPTYREIKERESEIAEMRQRLESTLHSYRGLRIKMNLLHDPFVTRVPLEVATTIFRFCLPQIHDSQTITCPIILDEDPDEAYNASVLFTLGGVCKSWRQIIWSTPQLWSHLSICVKPSTLPTSIDIAKDWLERSAQVPLSIQVYLSNLTVMQLVDAMPLEMMNQELMDGVTTLAKIINSCSSRWEYLDLRLPAPFFTMFHGEPSNLKKLRIENNIKTQSQEPNACLLTTEGGTKPNPTYVAFDFLRFDSLDISWSNVTCIETKGPNFQESIEILRNAPRLTECNFAIIQHPLDALLQPPIVHSALIDLRILVPIMGIACSDFLDHLTLPSLKNLSIDLHASPLPTQNILSLLERSSCELDTLDIGAVFVEETLVAMLRQIPSLYRVFLKSCATDTTFTAEGLFKLLTRTSEISYMDEDEDEDDDDSEDASDGDDNEDSFNDLAENSGQGSPDMREEGSSNEDIFLPELCYLTYITFRSEECTRIWDLIPDVFGYPARKEVSLDAEGPLRPLRSIFIGLEPPAWLRAGSLVRPQYISESTLGKMKELVECGCKIDVSVLLTLNTEPANFIVDSIAWHDEIKHTYD